MTDPASDAHSGPSGTSDSAGGPTVPAEPPRQSPWGLRQKIGRVLWSFASASLWRWSPAEADGFRRWLLRRFGARVGRGVTIHPSVHVEIPWHLELGDGVRVASRAILYCLGPVTIGPRTLVGPHAHVCAGTHDYRSPLFTLLRPPIEVGADCLLLTGSFVGPGAVLADGTVLRERASAYGETEPDTVYQGNPGKPVGPRGDDA